MADSEIRNWLIKPLLLSSTAIVISNDVSARVKQQAQSARRLWGDLVQICDGADDQAEINAAINALPATGGTVILSEGTYSISAPIVLVKNCALRGVGGGKAVQITLANNSDCNMIYFQQTDATSSFIYVGYLLLLGNKANQASGHGILFEWDGANVLKDFEIERVYVNACKEDGIKVDHGWGGHIHGCNSESNDGYAYYTHGNQIYVHDCYGSNSNDGFYVASNDQFYNNCYALGCTRHGFQVLSSNNSKFSNIKVYDPGTDGMNLNGDHMLFSNIEVHGDGGDAFDLNDVNYSQFIGGVIQAISGTWQNGFNIRSGSSHCTVSGFNFAGCTIGILVAAGTSYNHISNNLFDPASVPTPLSDAGTITSIRDDNQGITPMEVKHYAYAKNTSGGALAAGDVVRIKAGVASGEEVTTTVILGDDMVYGMAAEAIDNNAWGHILVKGKTTVLQASNDNGNIAIGDPLCASATAKEANLATAGTMGFAIALEACAVAGPVALDAYIKSPWI